VRAPIDTLSAPWFPKSLAWINVAALRMDKQLGRPVLVEFWDFCRANSLRTLDYVRGWHERYEPAGLRVVSAHAGAYPPSTDAEQVRVAVARLGIAHPVAIDGAFELWREYGNEGWPARYLFDDRLRLHSLHYGEGAYHETEAEICELLDIDAAAPFEALRPEDEPDAPLVAPTPEQAGAYSGPYEAGGAWAVLEVDPATACAIRVNGREIDVAYTGCHPLVQHDRHTAGALELELGDGVTCHAVQFTAGLVP